MMNDEKHCDTCDCHARVCGIKRHKVVKFLVRFACIPYSLVCVAILAFHIDKTLNEKSIPMYWMLMLSVGLNWIWIIMALIIPCIGSIKLLAEGCAALLLDWASRFYRCICFCVYFYSGRTTVERCYPLEHVVAYSPDESPEMFSNENPPPLPEKQGCIVGMKESPIIYDLPHKFKHSPSITDFENSPTKDQDVTLPGNLSQIGHVSGATSTMPKTVHTGGSTGARPKTGHTGGSTGARPKTGNTDGATSARFRTGQSSKAISVRPQTSPTSRNLGEIPKISPTSSSLGATLKTSPIASSIGSSPEASPSGASLAEKPKTRCLSPDTKRSLFVTSFGKTIDETENSDSIRQLDLSHIHVSISLPSSKRVAHSTHDPYEKDLSRDTIQSSVRLLDAEQVRNNPQAMSLGASQIDVGSHAEQSVSSYIPFATETQPQSPKTFRFPNPMHLKDSKNIDSSTLQSNKSNKQLSDSTRARMSTQDSPSSLHESPSGSTQDRVSPQGSLSGSARLRVSPQDSPSGSARLRVSPQDSPSGSARLRVSPQDSPSGSARLRVSPKSTGVHPSQPSYVPFIPYTKQQDVLPVVTHPNTDRRNSPHIHAIISSEHYETNLFTSSFGKTIDLTENIDDSILQLDASHIHVEILPRPEDSSPLNLKSKFTSQVSTSRSPHLKTSPQASASVSSHLKMSPLASESGCLQFKTSPLASESGSLLSKSSSMPSAPDSPYLKTSSHPSTHGSPVKTSLLANTSGSPLSRSSPLTPASSTAIHRMSPQTSALSFMHLATSSEAAPQISNYVPLALNQPGSTLRDSKLDQSEVFLRSSAEEHSANIDSDRDDEKRSIDNFADKKHESLNLCQNVSAKDICGVQPITEGQNYNDSTRTYTKFSVPSQKNSDRTETNSVQIIDSGQSSSLLSSSGSLECDDRNNIQESKLRRRIRTTSEKCEIKKSVSATTRSKTF